MSSILRLRAMLFPALAATALACTTGATDNDEGAAQPSQAAENGITTVGAPGSHVAVHGMVLFGAEKLYLSHIPLFSTPHNLQVVVEAKILSGVTSTVAFGNQNFTVRPSPFSLYDLAHGTLRNISGTIYLGNFESGGTPAFSNVKFEVTKVMYAASLLPTTPKSRSLDYLAVGTPTEPYLVHILDDRTAFDQILRVQLPADSWLDGARLGQGTFLSVVNGVNTMAGRPRANATVDTIPTETHPVTDAGVPDATPPVETDAGSPVEGDGGGPVATDAGAPSRGSDGGEAPDTDGGAPVVPPPPPATNPAVTVVGERSCLRGADFFQPCSP